ncbi:hypothetical protein FKV23_16120 [Lysobacter alkalisoli]|uniref:Uncharacterized protein n=1 Tax=Marilutibacter alkalisoli TaxID=2591633 RepID=A0A514BVQ3_9GAMM|nr:hypothetical protein FKV23_16120 [Lysobacter alkalisoli]
MTLGAALLLGCGQGSAPEADVGANAGRSGALDLAVETDIVEQDAAERVSSDAGIGGRASPEVEDPRALYELEHWRHAWHVAVRDHLRAHAAAGDGRAQLALAVLPLESTRKPTDPTMLALHEKKRKADRAEAFARALEMMPDDPLANWLAAAECDPVDPSCDRQAWDARLQALEPDNAAVWLSELQRAQAAGDDAAVDAALERMAQASFQDAHVTDLSRMLADQLAAVASPVPSPQVAAAAGEQMGLGRPATADEMKLVEVNATWAAFALPAFQGLTRACRPPLPPARTGLCQGAASRVASGDTLIERLIGLVTQVRLSAGSAGGAVWRESLRQHYWQHEALSRQFQQGVPVGYTERMLQQGEMAAIQWLLEQRGQSQSPPGWLPSNPRQRALVITGRDPHGDENAPVPPPPP